MAFGLGLASWLMAQVPAFPGAEGFGKYTTGGRGGKVVVVTSLEDDGEGSLRKALRMKEPRIIVFAVSGTIELKSSLDINYGDLTIAGQTAPGDGITLKNYPIKVKGDNVIIRYIRSRMGDEQGIQDDAISVIRQKNVIIDHCSFSWGTDECASFYDNENMTVQWCMVTESLNSSVHTKGEHGYGGIWGGKQATFHHNLLAHHKSRTPRFNGARYHKDPTAEIVDFRNNVIYNWQSNNSYAGEQGNHNVVNNLYKPGPATQSKEDKFLNPWEPYGTYFVAGNVLVGDEEVTQNNEKGISVKTADMPFLLQQPITVAEVSTQAAAEACRLVLAQAGASFRRDVVDTRIAKEVAEGKATFGTGIIDSQQQVGGWPLLAGEKAPQDTDQDGMPDRWEAKHKLNPSNAEDAAQHDLSKDYTNIEVYINELVAG